MKSPLVSGRHRLASGLALLIAALCLLAGPVAAAAADPESARTAQAKVQDGVHQLERGKFEAALQLFQEAFALTGNARYQYNIGIASQQLGRSVEALEAFERFIVDAPGITREHRRDAETRVAALKKKVAELEVGGEAGAQLTLDGRAAGTTPLGRPLRTTPGDHVLAATKEGFRPFEQRVTLPRGGRVNVAVALERVAPVTVRPPPAAAPAQPPPVALAIKPPPPTKQPDVMVAAPPPQRPEESQRKRRLLLWGGVGAALLAVAAVSVVLVAGKGKNPSCPTGVDQCLGP